MPEPGDPSAEQNDADRYPDNSALFHPLRQVSNNYSND